MESFVFAFFAMGVLALFAFWLIGVGINEKIKRSMISRNGVKTRGTITERKHKGREPGIVYYSFQHADRTYEAQQRVNFDHMDRINIGDTVDIRYLPSDPTVARLAGRDADDPWSTRPIAIGGLILMIILVGILGLLYIPAR